VKINLVDTPGFHMFCTRRGAAMLPVEAALVVVNAQIGVEAVTDRGVEVRRRGEPARAPWSSLRWTIPRPIAVRDGIR